MPRQIYRCAGLALVLALLAACGGGDEPSVPAPFGYDSQALDVKRTPTSLGNGDVKVEEISFAGPGETRLTGYLATPTGSETHPAVIYAHGAGGDRQELLDEARSMAERGAVALTLDMNYSPSRRKGLPTTGMEAIRANSDLEVETVKEVRRAVDLLRSLDSVDGDRIGYVGWSRGARMGAVISGIEPRIKAFDLIAGGAAPVSVYLDAAPAELRPELREILEKTDPLSHVAQAAPSELLFQLGRQDKLVPKAALRELARAGSEPKEVRWYESGHSPSEELWADSREWLADELELD